MKACVMIPSCNRPNLLHWITSQILEQMQEEDLIIIINDGEPDSIPNDISADQKIEVIQHCKSYYAVASGRNLGVEKALELGYNWGIFLDDDCEITKDWLDEYRKSWEKKKTLYVGKLLNERSLNKDFRAPRTGMPGKKEDMSEGLLLQMGGFNSSCYLPSFCGIGGFDENFDGHYGYADIELSHRLLIKNDWDLEYLEKATAVNLRTPPGQTYRRDDQANKEKFLEKASDSIKELYNEPS